MPFKVGDFVTAVKHIIEPGRHGMDSPYSPHAKPCDPGWCYASPGCLGVVDHVTENGIPTVKWFATATYTIVSMDEVRAEVAG